MDNRFANTNIEALNQLVRVLKAVNPRQFDLTVWFKEKYIVGSCGCAIGWAMQDPWFVERGLHGEELPSRRREGILTKMYKQPVFDGHDHWGAVRRFFGLTMDDTKYLFSPAEYPVDKPSAETVIGRVHEIIRLATVAQAVAPKDVPPKADKPLPEELTGLLESELVTASVVLSYAAMFAAAGLILWAVFSMGVMAFVIEVVVDLLSGLFD